MPMFSKTLQKKFEPSRSNPDFFLSAKIRNVQKWRHLGGNRTVMLEELYDMERLSSMSGREKLNENCLNDPFPPQ